MENLELFTESVINPEPIRNVVARNVQRYRTMEKMTQAQLAEKTNLSTTYIANIECGKTWISDTTLEALTHALHIAPQLLFTRRGEAIPGKKEEEEKIKIFNKYEKEFGEKLQELFDDLGEVYKHN